ncbi:MAG: glycosyltransferase [Actinomycetota bacterium]
MLAAVVVRDGLADLGDCLRALASQTHPRLGVLAIHNGRMDGPRGLLERALGPSRVLEDGRDEGMAGAMRVLRALPAAEAADYVLLLHDDVALAPDAVARLVEAAELGAVERVGVVGPKIVDWDDPRILREVGSSADGFGHRYVTLQEDERDQGQFDRILEVLAVSSCAVLLSRDAWARLDPFDERLEGHHEDIDFCWRARLAGYRVLMTPLALARHHAPPGRGERRQRSRRGARYYAERSALATMLKDLGALQLALMLPLFLVTSAGRLAYLALARRFADALDLSTAIGWNLRNLPGTLRRRRRAQRARRVRDAAVLRFVTSPFQFQRWFERAEEFLEDPLEAGEEAGPRAGIRERALSVLVGRPVLIAAVVGIVSTWIGMRTLRETALLTGGSLAAFPARASTFLSEFLAPVRTTLLGGGDAASPALAPLAALSWLSFGRPFAAQRLLLVGLLPIAAILAYRGMRRQGIGAGAGVLGAACYVTSGALLWSLSDGRLPLLVLAAVLPLVWDRLETMAAAVDVDRRIAVGLGMTLAVATAFLPATVLALALVLLVHVGLRRRAGATLRSLATALAAAALLAFPVVAGAVLAPNSTLGSLVGTTDPGRILRFAIGDGPGTGWSAYFLPVAAVLCFALVRPDERERASRSLATMLVGGVLGWLSAARYLPEPIANAPVYLVVAAFAASALVAEGLTSIAGYVAERGFGLRQVTAGFLGIVLVLGLGAQGLQVLVGEWGIGRDRLPAAWPLVASESGDFRILWLGAPSADPFPSPGGDPQGVLTSGGVAVRWAITGRNGTSALDLGRGVRGPGYDYLRRVLAELLSGRSEHGGALLAPLAVRFIVAAEDDLPAAVVERLALQADIDPVPAGGLEIFRNARALPVASVAVGPALGLAAREGDRLGPVAAMPLIERRELVASGTARWSGETLGGTAYLAVQDGGGWRGPAGEGATAFGWAVVLEAPPGPVVVDHAGSWFRRIEVLLLLALWIGAVWATRRPVSA